MHRKVFISITALPVWASRRIQFTTTGTRVLLLDVGLIDLGFHTPMLDLISIRLLVEQQAYLR